MNRIMVVVALAVLALVAVQPAASAAPELCAGNTSCYVLGGQMRTALAERGVQRPGVGSVALGYIASDICERNDVRTSLEWVLITPDVQIAAFFRAGHAVC